MANSEPLTERYRFVATITDRWPIFAAFWAAVDRLVQTESSYVAAFSMPSLSHGMKNALRSVRHEECSNPVWTAPL